MGKNKAILWNWTSKKSSRQRQSGCILDRLQDTQNSKLDNYNWALGLNPLFLVGKLHFAGVKFQGSTKNKKKWMFDDKSVSLYPPPKIKCVGMTKSSFCTAERCTVCALPHTYLICVGKIVLGGKIYHIWIKHIRVINFGAHIHLRIHTHSHTYVYWQNTCAENGKATAVALNIYVTVGAMV